jgi:hypothetical protein
MKRQKKRQTTGFFPMESEPSSSSSPLPDGISSKRTLRHPPTRKYLPPEQGDEVTI